MAGQLQHFFGLLGMSSHKGIPSDPDNGQHEFRMRVTTHEGTNAA